MNPIYKKISFIDCNGLVVLLLSVYLFKSGLTFADPDLLSSQKTLHRRHEASQTMLLDKETSECKSSAQSKQYEYSSYDLFFQRQDHNFVPCKIIKKSPVLTTQEMSIDILPHKAIQVLEKEAQDTYMGVVPFDLNGDGLDEYIVRGGQPSGGTQFYFLQKHNRKWEVITYFSGGFVLSSPNNVKDHKAYYDITFWHRYGMNETHEYKLAYKNGQYIEVSDKTIPTNILQSYDFLRKMRELNGFLGLEQWN